MVSVRIRLSTLMDYVVSVPFMLVQRQIRWATSLKPLGCMQNDLMVDHVLIFFLRDVGSNDGILKSGQGYYGVGNYKFSARVLHKSTKANIVDLSISSCDKVWQERQQRLGWRLHTGSYGSSATSTFLSGANSK